MPLNILQGEYSIEIRKDEDGSEMCMKITNKTYLPKTSVLKEKKIFQK